MSIASKIANKSWVYVLNQQAPHPNCSDIFQVCIAVLGEPDIVPVTLQDSSDWYMSQDQCDELNRVRGYQPSDVDSIVTKCKKYKIQHRERNINNGRYFDWSPRTYTIGDAEDEVEILKKEFPEKPFRIISVSGSK